MNDALRLRHDPAMRWIIGGKATKRSGASPSRMGRFETDWLARPENLETLTDLSGHWIDQAVAAEGCAQTWISRQSLHATCSGRLHGSYV